ncbi:MAG: HPr kinase/phosphorylase [Eubacteriaceae bacterium]|nr:HPr kinase/phosphorylase [Eubacteriaceae bacterium]
MKGKVSLDEFTKELCLEKIYCPRDELDLLGSGINRPGLQLYGFYEHFDPNRIQVIGKVEVAYLMSLDEGSRNQKIDDFFAYDFPCFIVCWDLEEVEIFIPFAEKYGRFLFRSREHTTSLFYHLVSFLDQLLAPTISLHGVLVEVFGVGVLIMGPSGIGKSETALEIVKRGHCLIADDVVEVKRIRDSYLMGTAPELLQHFMEIRGIGIIDVKTLFGAQAVKRVVEIDMVIKLENWDDRSPYDRLGLDEQTMDILGMQVPQVMIPVSSGRNLSSIIETAAINNRTKQYGYHSAQVFCDRITDFNDEEVKRREKNKNSK